jgi:ribonuclease D
MIDIQTNQDLKDLCEEASRQTSIALDTEFIRERTFFPILALVQIGWKEREPVLIDPLTIDDWAPFHDLLTNPNICKLFHSGRQDLEIFYNQMGRLPENMFDTQIAASMCGLGDQIGYSALVERLLGVHLAKGSSYTNWLQRPLTSNQLRYARDDVRYLPEVYEKLVSRAQEKKRLDWILQEVEDQLNQKLFEPDLDELWRKVKKVSSVRERNLIVLQALTRWRHETARVIDRPVRYLLSDEVMVELSKIDHLTMENLNSRRGMQPKIIDRYGAELIDLHTTARAKPKSEWPTLRENNRRPPSEKSEALAGLAWLLLKEIASKADMAPSNLINKRDLANFIETHHRGGDLSQFPIGSGWRKKMVGAPLLDLIEGRLAIRVVKRRIIWEPVED